MHLKPLSNVSTYDVAISNLKQESLQGARILKS